MLGQPLLVRSGNARDRGLADFPEQYARLCRALASAPSDVVVLSGDVHFGRVAEIETPGAGVRLFEVISSPMALVSLFRGRIALAAGQFTGDITVFPFAAEPAADQAAEVGRVRYAVPVESTGRRCEDHYMTLRFTRLPDDAGISVEVLAHLLRQPPGNLPARVQPITTFTIGGAR